jgi:hypothetical protein
MVARPLPFRAGKRHGAGAGSLSVVLSQLLDAAVELEELAQAGYVLEQPVEADGLRLSRVATAEEIPGRHPGRHHTRISGLSGTPDPRNHADAAWIGGCRWA